jgi:hypothetical protein
MGRGTGLYCSAAKRRDPGPVQGRVHALARDQAFSLRLINRVYRFKCRHNTSMDGWSVLHLHGRIS